MKDPVHRKKVLANIDCSYLYEEYLQEELYMRHAGEVVRS